MRRFNLSYNNGGEIIDLVIRDGSGRKIDTFKCSLKDFPKIVNTIKRKYGIVFKQEVDKDLEWLKKI